MFLLIRVINKLKREAPPAPPDTRECPHCCSTISIKATRCAHCTAEVPAAS
ncbi:MAG TPA: large conductance mechanosensitive channel protein MscL, partial [Acidobacteriota bacterium]|nr:large conductance mechanosensitive channel protein MscL [Acidobacteriota bacterium]